MFRRGLSLGDALCLLEPWYGGTLLAMKQGEYSGGEKAPITGGKRKLINGAGIESAKSANEANRYVAGKSNAGFKGGSLLTYPPISPIALSTTQVRHHGHVPVVRRRKLRVHLTSQCDPVPLGALMSRNQVVSDENMRILDTGRWKRECSFSSVFRIFRCLFGRLHNNLLTGRGI